MKLSLSLFVMLALTWWLLSGHADVLLLALGLASVGFTVWLANRMAVVDRESHPVHLGIGLIGFWLQLLRDIVIANVQVVRLIFAPRARLDPQMVGARMRQGSGLAQAVLANAITLTPGTVTVDIDDRSLLVHALERAGADEVVAGVMDARVPLDEEKGS